MFSEVLKKLRNSHSMSQVALSQKLGVSKQCVSNWENGYIQPSVEMLIKISALFSVSTDYVLGLCSKNTIDASGLSDTQIAHIQSIVNDLSSRNKL